MSKYLVTGSAGFIASHVVDLLISQGHQVTGVDNLSNGKIGNINPQSQFYNRDITDPVFWSILERFDCVFHLAALPRIQPSIKDPMPAHDTNINGTLQVLEYCRRQKTKLVFSSSSSIYKGDDLPARETATIKPKNPYTLQKYVCEQYIELYHELYNLDYTILRYFNVYGERQLLEGAYATVLGIFLQQRKQGLPLPITNDGEQRRDFTYVGDVARANLAAVDWQGTFNIGSGRNWSINEIADMVGGTTKNVGTRLGEARQTLADNTKAAKMGWYPQVSVKDWIHHAI